MALVSVGRAVTVLVGCWISFCWGRNLFASCVVNLFPTAGQSEPAVGGWKEEEATDCAHGFPWGMSEA